MSDISKKTKSLAYGINIVWGTSGTDDDWKRNDMHLKLMQYAKEIGATNCRPGITWCVIEENQGEYDWSATDERINFLHENGFEMVACVANTPVWAMGLDDETLNLVKTRYPDFLTVLPCADEHLEAIAKWCAEAARRYKGKVKFYEIGNEDDGCPAPIVVRDYAGKPIDIRLTGDAAIYTKRLKTCYTAIKSVDPDAKVGISGLQGEGSTGFLEQIYANGGRDYFDAVGLHPYVKSNGQGIYWQWLDQVKELLDLMGDSHKKFWLTEWGFSVENDPQSLAEHADVIEQVLLRMEKLDYIEQASLHTLNDWRTNETDPKSVQGMGLMTYDLQPKPAFYAFKKAAHGEGEMRDAFPQPQIVMREPGDSDPVICKFAATAPSISGKLEDWQDAQPLPLKDQDGNQKASAFIKWDTDNLYFAVQVMDSYHYQPYGGEWMWKGDSIQIAFDPDRETRRWPGYGYDDTELGFCLTPAGVQGIRFHGGIFFPCGTVTPVKDEPLVTQAPVKVAVNNLGGSHLYEAAVPWSEITTKSVSEGKLIGLSIAVNNYDEAGERTILELGSGITEGKDPALFIPIKLVR